MLMLASQKIKPSQRCQKCGKIRKKWAKVSNRHYVCSNCNFEIQREQGSVIINFNYFSTFIRNAIIIINNY
jgi:putative transposase